MYNTELTVPQQQLKKLIDYLSTICKNKNP